MAVAFISLSKLYMFGMLDFRFLSGVFEGLVVWKHDIKTKTLTLMPNRCNIVEFREIGKLKKTKDKSNPQSRGY